MSFPMVFLAFAIAVPHRLTLNKKIENKL